MLNFRKFVEVVGQATTINLRVARLRAAQSSTPSKSKREQIFGVTRKKKKAAAQRVVEVGAAAGGGAQSPAAHKPKAAMPALREVKLVKETEDTKIGAVFHRLDDAFDKSFFNVEGSSVQPIIKKVDPGSMAEMAGLVPGDIVLSVNGVSGLSNFQVTSRKYLPRTREPRCRDAGEPRRESRDAQPPTPARLPSPPTRLPHTPTRLQPPHTPRRSTRGS